MDNILNGCFIASLCRAFSRAFPGSVAGKLVAVIKNSYMTSYTRKVVSAFLLKTPKIVYSRIYALFSKLNAALSKLGPVFEESFIISLARKLFSCGLLEGSLVVSGLKKLGMRGLLLVCFALYLPLDVFIRDVLGIAFLSSIWDEAFLLFCVGYILWDIISSKGRIKPRITPLDGPLLFFMAAGLLVMAVVSPKLSVAISGYRAVCQFMLWFFVLIRLFKSEKDIKVMYFSICAMAVAVALHGIYQYITNVPMPEAWVAKAEMGVRTRVFSITGSPNIMGALMVMTAPMLAACAYYSKKLWVKCFMWGATGLICLATLFTFSRGAWFGLTIAVVVFALLVDLKLLVFAAIGILGVIFCVPEISNRITFLFTSDFAAANSTGGRGERWNIGISLWRQNRIFGFGLGRYGGAIAMQNQEIENIVYYYMDNYYLKTLTEMGLIGLISYVWLLLKSVVWSIRSIFKTRKSGIAVLSSGIVAGASGVLAHSFFENIFEVPYMNAYFWGLLAIVMFLGFLKKSIKG